MRIPKNNTVKRFLPLVLGAYLLVPVNAWCGGWLDDWFSSKTETQGGFFQGQQRGYATGGGFNARWPQTTPTNFVSVQPPHFKSGCGGIDAYWGSVSFLNPDMLVEKLQRILQNSAGVGFNMALDTLCPKCATVMKDMEAISNSLNSLALNDCQAAKSLVNGLSSKMDLQNKTMSDNAVNNLLDWGLANNFTQAKNTIQTYAGDWNKALNSQAGNGADTLSVMTECPGDLGVFFPPNMNDYPISMMQKLFERKGVGAEAAAFADLARGMVGDIIIGVEDGIISAEPEPPCSENKDLKVGDVINGRINEKKASVLYPGTYACSTISGGIGSMGSVVQSKIAWTRKMMKEKGSLDSDPTLKTFLDSMPMPVHYALRMAEASGQGGVVETSLSQLLTFLYFSQAMSDLLTAATKVESLATNAKKSGLDSDKCKASVAINALEGAIPGFTQTANKGTKLLMEAETKAVDDYIKELEIQTTLQNFSDRIEAAVAKSFGPQVANRIKMRMHH